MTRPAPADTSTGTAPAGAGASTGAPALHAPWTVWLLAQVAAVTPVGICLIVAAVAGEASGAGAVRYGQGAVAALAVQNGYTWVLRRRIGPERASPADAITHARGGAAASLVGLVVAGYVGTPPVAGWLTFGIVLLAATLLD